MTIEELATEEGIEALGNMSDTGLMSLALHIAEDKDTPDGVAMLIHELNARLDSYSPWRT